MITIEMLPILMKIAAKLDLAPIIERVKGADIFEAATDKSEIIKQLSREKLGFLAGEVLSEILPQLGRIADDLPLFVSVYKEVTLDEAKKLDAAEVINEIINDQGIRSFFSRAIRKKVEQTH
ncbi:MAG: hypothetical protein LBL82_00185 [Oscillospiraceae bacterium]|jgi:hypothetical protein|nr:hypothetical protein [Oscillospiraceae bacterium]